LALGTKDPLKYFKIFKEYDFNYCVFLSTNIHSKYSNNNMDIRTDKALAIFRNGFNCSQAVFGAYSEITGIDEIASSNIAAGFGAGMGRLQKTCGAVTGAYMVLGAIQGKEYVDNAEKKEVVYSLIRKFDEKFTLMNGSTDCITLLGTEIMSPEGMQNAKEKNLFGTICEKCVQDAVDIVNELTIKINHKEH